MVRGPHVIRRTADPGRVRGFHPLTGSLTRPRASDVAGGPTSALIPAGSEVGPSPNEGRVWGEWVQVGTTTCVHEIKYTVKLGNNGRHSSFLGPVRRFRRPTLIYGCVKSGMDSGPAERYVRDRERVLPRARRPSRWQR